MSDSRDNRTDLFGDEGFDWFAESKKVKKGFDSFEPQKENRYGGFEKKPPSGNSVFSDGYAGQSRYTYPPERFSSAGHPGKNRTVREDSVYHHSDARRTNNSKNTAPRQRTPERASGSSNKKRKAAGKLRTPTKRTPENGRPAASKKSGTKSPTGKAVKKQQPARQGGRQPSQLQKRASAGEKRRIEKSSESYDKAIRQGKSKDELRKIRSKKKRRARQFRIALTVFAVMAFAAVFALVFCFTRGAPIAKIVIEGSKTYTESEILSAAGIVEGDNMLMIRQKKTNEAVTTKLPYISKIKVDYQLPDTLRLVVSETDEKYYIVNGQAYLCVDKNDKIVSDLKKKVKGNKYRIEGLESQEYLVGKAFVPNEENGNQKKYEIAKKLVSAIEEAGLENCNVINVANADRIYVVYDSKVWMYLKEDSDFAYEMKFAAQALSDSRTSEIISSSQRCYIDLRLGNQAVFKTGKLS